MEEWIKKELFECSDCGNKLFLVDLETFLRGDKPTVLICPLCGYTTYA